MTDLRDQPIRIQRSTNLGQLLAQLRRNAGHTSLSLARRLHISRSGMSKRENAHGMSAAALVEHLAALGYDLALIPREDQP